MYYVFLRKLLDWSTNNLDVLRGIRITEFKNIIMNTIASLFDSHICIFHKNHTHAYSIFLGVVSSVTIRSAQEGVPPFKGFLIQAKRVNNYGINEGEFIPISGTHQTCSNYGVRIHTGPPASSLRESMQGLPHTHFCRHFGYNYVNLVNYGYGGGSTQKSLSFIMEIFYIEYVYAVNSRYDKRF